MNSIDIDIVQPWQEESSSDDHVFDGCGMILLPVLTVVFYCAALFINWLLPLGGNA